KVPGAKTVATRTGKDWPGEVHIQIIPGNGTGPPGTQLTIQLSNLRQRVRWCTDQILVVQQADHLHGNGIAIDPFANRDRLPGERRYNLSHMGRGNDGLQMTFVDTAIKTDMWPDNDVRGPCSEPDEIVDSMQIIGGFVTELNA